MIEMAGCVIHDNRGGLLLLHKTGRFWELPGGKIEKGETPAQAATREGHEELGEVVCVDEGKPLEVFETTINDNDYRYSYFKARIAGDNIPMANEMDTHCDLRYMLQDQLYTLSAQQKLSVFVIHLINRELIK